MCSSMKHPNPERLVETLGMPMTVHSAAGGGGTMITKKRGGGINRGTQTSGGPPHPPHPGCALTGGVAPGFVVGGEDPQVTPPDKFLVVDRQEGAGGGQELGVEDDLVVGGGTQS